MSERFYLSQDNDSHWYIIPVDNETDWQDFLELDPDDDEAWEPPSFAVPTDGGPTMVTFTDPRQE